MRAVAVRSQRDARLPAALLVLSLLVMTVAAPTKPSVALAGAAVALAVPFVWLHQWLLAWRRLLSLTILVILFIPIKRYGLPGNLPFDLEPYRLVVGLVIAGWFVSLLIDPRVRFRKAGLEGPILAIAFASILSDLTNSQRIQSLLVQAEVIKGLMFLG